jgi:hypothetical protein
MEKIEVEITKVDITFYLQDVIRGINNLPTKRRWQYIANILTEIESNISDLTE